MYDILMIQLMKNTSSNNLRSITFAFTLYQFFNISKQIKTYVHIIPQKAISICSFRLPFLLLGFHKSLL